MHLKSELTAAFVFVNSFRSYVQDPDFLEEINICMASEIGAWWFFPVESQKFVKNFKFLKLRLLTENHMCHKFCSGECWLLFWAVYITHWTHTFTVIYLQLKLETLQTRQFIKGICFISLRSPALYLYDFFLFWSRMPYIDKYQLYLVYFCIFSLWLSRFVESFETSFII